MLADHALDHLFVLAFAVVFPIHAFFSYRRFVARAATLEPGVRLREYRATIVVQWLLAAAAIAVWIHGGRDLASLGLAPPLGRGGLFVVAVCLGIAIFFEMQRRAASTPDADLSDLAPQIEPVRDLMPHDASERSTFVALAITAGICEEILFRGFLIGYLRALLPFATGTNTVVAVLIATTVFGLGHAYQGVAGALKTAVAGLLTSILFVAGSSLLPLMLLHAIVDVAGGWIGHLYVSRYPRKGSTPTGA